MCFAFVTKQTAFVFHPCYFIYRYFPFCDEKQSIVYIFTTFFRVDGHQVVFILVGI